MPTSPEQRNQARRLADAGIDPDAFDAISMGAEAIRDYASSFASHERNQDGLTYALAVAKMGVGEEIKAFHEKGGLFTDQRDDLGKTAEDILAELVAEAKKARVDGDYRKAIGFETAAGHELNEVIFTGRRRSAPIIWRCAGRAG